MSMNGALFVLCVIFTKNVSWVTRMKRSIKAQSGFLLQFIKRGGEMAYLEFDVMI